MFRPINVLAEAHEQRATSRIAERTPHVRNLFDLSDPTIEPFELIIAGLPIHQEQIVGGCPCISETIEGIISSLCPLQKRDGVAESCIPPARGRISADFLFL